MAIKKPYPASYLRRTGYGEGRMLNALIRLRLLTETQENP